MRPRDRLLGLRSASGRRISVKNEDLGRFEAEHPRCLVPGLFGKLYQMRSDWLSKQPLHPPWQRVAVARAAPFLPPLQIPLYGLADTHGLNQNRGSAMVTRSQPRAIKPNYGLSQFGKIPWVWAAFGVVNSIIRHHSNPGTHPAISHTDTLLPTTHTPLLDLSLPLSPLALPSREMGCRHDTSDKEPACQPEKKERRRRRNHHTVDPPVTGISLRGLTCPLALARSRACLSWNLIYF